MDALTQITSELIASFAPVYDEWAKKLSASSTLTAATAGKNACKILEEDVRDFGLGLMNVDKIGKTPELAYIAEAVAHLRIPNVQMEHEKNLDYQTDRVLGELKAAPAVTLAVPLCIKISREVNDAGSYSKNLLDLKQCFMRLADAVFMRDGNLSSEELATLKTLDSLLG